MPIKDKAYWKEYNQKRKEYLTHKKREERTKLKMSTTTPPLSTTEPLKIVVNRVVDTKNILPVVDIPQVVDRNIKVVDTELKKEVVDQKKNLSTTPEKIIQPIQPKAELIQPLKCSRCPEIENSISEFANLYQQEQEKNKELTKELKNSQQAIQASQKSCQEASKVINDYQGIVKDLQTKNQSLIQNLTDLKNQAPNQTNSLSLSNLNHLITKHTKIQNSQHRYSEKDTREREFLKNLLDRLWQFN